MLLLSKNSFSFCSLFSSFWASFCFAPTPALSDSFGNTSGESGADLPWRLSWECFYSPWDKTAAWLLLLKAPGPCWQSGSALCTTLSDCIRHEVVVCEGLTLGYRIYRTKIKPPSMTERWETNLTAQPNRQKNDETAQVFRVELLKMLEFF